MSPVSIESTKGEIHVSAADPENWTFPDYVEIFRRRLLAIVVVLVLFLGLGLGIDLTSTKVYTSSASLGLLSQNVSSYNGILELTAQDIATDIQLVQSRVLQHLASGILKQNAALPSVKEVGQTTIVTISVSSTNPTFAAAAANAYATSYVNYTTALYNNQFTKELSVLDTSRQDLSTQIAALQAQLAVTKASTTTAQSLNNQLNNLSAQLATVNSSITQLELDKSQVRSGAYVAGVATAPTAPSSPKLQLDLSIGGVLGVILGLVLAIVLELFDDRIRDRDSLVTTLKGVNILGEIPRIEEGKGLPANAIVSEKLPKSIAAESYRNFRTSVQYLTYTSETDKVIQITSALQGEGKSTTAINLAVTLAQNGQRVVIVDCDMRRPTIHKYFGLDNSVGLSTTLKGDVDTSEVLTPTQADAHLVCVPSGPNPTNPSELLSSKAMRDLLDRLRNDFDYVILDSPALLPVADSLLLAQLSDVVIVVIRMMKTRTRALSSTLERLQSVNAPVRGTVLNDSFKRLIGYGRYGNYGYGQDS